MGRTPDNAVTALTDSVTGGRPGRLASGHAFRRVSRPLGSRRHRALRRDRRARRRLVRRRGARDRRADRPQRRREDHALQLPVASLRPLGRRARVRGPSHRCNPVPPHRGPRDQPHLPEPRALSEPVRPTERDDRDALSDGSQLHRERAPASRRASRGSNDLGASAGARGVLRARGRRRPPGRRSPLRHPQARRAGAGPRGGAAAPPARRARRGPEPRGSGGAGGAHHGDPEGARRHHPPGRAPHGAGDAGVRPRRGARLRPEDRRGHARGDPAGPRRHPGVPRHRPDDAAR